MVDGEGEVEGESDGGCVIVGTILRQEYNAGMLIWEYITPTVRVMLVEGEGETVGDAECDADREGDKERDGEEDRVGLADREREISGEDEGETDGEGLGE